jgi:thiol:disulfide interchange protein DsbD
MYDEKAGSLRPLKLLSGLAPPACYSWWYPCDCPQNLNCFKDFDEGLAFAKKMNKPIMIDFTGHACVNCRKMEEHVWPLPGVYKYLRDDYVLISLYVDEKIDLPVEEQKVVEMKSGGTRKLRNIGHKWHYFQTENFDNNSQPFYVLLSPDGKMLNQPVGYTPDASEYANFLECGLERFRNLKEESKMLGAKE